MFRKSLAIVMLTAVCSWFALSVMFAVFIWIAGMAHPGCIGGSESFGHFSDAFLLSWTTFSTVVRMAIGCGPRFDWKGRDFISSRRVEAVAPSVSHPCVDSNRAMGAST
jgi:hypothetical protein